MVSMGGGGGGGGYRTEILYCNILHVNVLIDIYSIIMFMLCILTVY